MMYSYITPRKKSVFTQEVQVVLSFFIITLLMLFFTYTFLLYKNYIFLEDKNYKTLAKVNLEKSLAKMKIEILYIQKQELLSEKIATKNIILKDSVTNLFDLVPTHITLSQAKLLKDGLILYGLTPNKDIYNFMLQAPLRSIFHRTYSSFYPAQNGWLNFVSTNYIDDMEADHAK